MSSWAESKNIIKKKEIDSKLSRLDHCFLYKYICISKSKKDGEGGGMCKIFCIVFFYNDTRGVWSF